MKHVYNFRDQNEPLVFLSYFQRKWFLSFSQEESRTRMDIQYGFSSLYIKKIPCNQLNCDCANLAIMPTSSKESTLPIINRILSSCIKHTYKFHTNILVIFGFSPVIREVLTLYIKGKYPLFLPWLFNPETQHSCQGCVFFFFFSR